MSERHDVASQVQNPGAAPSEDDLLGVIADVEKQLAALRQFRTERDETKQRLEEREAALHIRQQEIDNLQAQIQAQRSDLEQRRHALEGAESAMHEARQQLERDQHEAITAREQAQQDRQRLTAEIQQQAETLADREHRLAEGAAALSRQREELEQAAAALAQRERAAHEAGQQSEQLRRELAELRASCDQAQALAASHERTVDSLREQGQKLMAELAAARGESQELKSELDHARAAGAESQAQLAAREQALAAAEERARAATAELQQHLSASASQHGEVESLKSVIAERDGRIEELSRKLATATEALQLAAQQLAEAGQNSDQSQQFQAQLAARDEQIAALHADLEQSRAATAAAADKLREFAQAASEQSASAGQAQQFQAQLQASAQRIADLEAQLAGAQAQAAAAQERLAAAKAHESADSAAVQAKLTQLMDRTEELEEALQIAHTEMQRLIADNKGLREQTAASQSALGKVPAEVGEAVARRWERLRLVRKLLNERTEKVNKAGEVLRARYEECEEILKQREAVAKAHASLNENRRNLEKLQGQASKTRSFSLLFYAVATIGLLAGISYAIAMQIAPATYAVRAIIAADVPPVGASDDQLSEWQRHHENLLHDPRVLDGAAERMGRRGIVSLSKSADLDAFLKQVMTSETGAPGQLTVEIKGRNGAHLTRVLDTYIAALASTGNASKERRADGLGTKVMEAASTGSGPVSDLRLLYATVIFAGSLGLAFFFVTTFGKRIAAAKQAFEKEQVVEIMEDEASWREAAEKIRQR